MSWINATGRENDGTGLKYYRARYYHPHLHRFIAEDPIGFASGDTNLFAYVFNQPTYFRDPTGNVVVPVAVTLGAACVVGAPFGIASVTIMVGRKPTISEAAYGAALGCGVGMMTVISAGAAAAGAAVGTTASASLSTTASTGPVFAAGKLASHFADHRSEFSYRTPEEYLRGAQKLMAQGAEGVITFVRSSGDTLFYRAATNEFAVLSKDNLIRTYFKPIEGAQYWARQIGKP